MFVENPFNLRGPSQRDGMFVGVNTRSGHRPLFQPHTNIASPWDAYARATPLLQTLRPYGTRPPPLHRFYKHGVPTGRGTPPITRSVNSKILTYNGAGHRITPDVNHQNFRSARNEDPQPTCPSGTKCVAQSSNVGNRPRGTARL